MTDRKYIKSVLDNFQGKRSPAVNIEKDDARFPGMATYTATEGFRKCFKCGASDHEARNCRDLCLRLVLFQDINWTYAKHIKETIGAYKITVGATNKANRKLGLRPFQNGRRERSRNTRAPKNVSEGPSP